jgi:pimeloyl-ACP methyl ester carboxylesterase
MMNSVTQTIIFLVGLGAPANLYDDYLDDLRKKLPQTKLFVLEWWSQNDFGLRILQSYIGDSELILIGHSGGSVIALQALEKWPNSIKKIVMLDSHFLRTHQSLPTVARMLDIILINNKLSIQNKIRAAYAPLLINDVAFTKALNYAIQWVNERFDMTCHSLNTLPSHSVLFIGFTNSSYQILNNEEINALSVQWKKINVDVNFFAINHFDLIENKNASVINQVIATWLSIDFTN